jgi:hypothetical protein
MTTFPQLKQIIYNWVKDNSNLPPENIIFSHQNTPKPNDDFIEINPKIKIEKTYRKDQQKFKNDGTIDVYLTRDVTVLLNGYGKDILNNMLSILNSIDKPTVYEKFRENDIAIIEIDELIDLSDVDGDFYINQTQLMIIFQYNETVNDNTGYFDKVTASEIQTNITTALTNIKLI